MNYNEKPTRRNSWVRKHTNLKNRKKFSLGFRIHQEEKSKNITNMRIVHHRAHTIIGTTFLDDKQSTKLF